LNTKVDSLNFLDKSTHPLLDASLGGLQPILVSYEALLAVARHLTRYSQEVGDYFMEDLQLKGVILHQQYLF
jgi:hypothetical protein